MKRLLHAIGATALLLCLAALILRTTGLNLKGPRAGLWLSGDLVTAPVTNWSFSGRYPLIELETHTWYRIPHSGTVYCVSYNNQLYLQALGKMWNRNVVRDPSVRIKIADRLYDRTVVYVNDPAEYWGVARSMARKYRGWALPKDFEPHAFLRVTNK